MEEQEKELLDNYRRLCSESKNFILSTIITAVIAENAMRRQYGLSAGADGAGASRSCGVGEVRICR
jgi:hypothetical protein